MDKKYVKMLSNTLADVEAKQRIKESGGDTGEAIRAQLQRATRISTEINLDRAALSSGTTNDSVIHQPTDDSGNPLHHYCIITNPESPQRLDIKVSFEIVDRDDV